jgi:hypothetical protein
MTDLMRPEDLKKVTSDAEMKKAAEHLKAAKKQEEEQKALLEMFMAREISPKASERINEAVRRAAEQGLNEFQVITFASTYCNDRGRRINNNEPDWPDSLARSIHAYTTCASLGRHEFARRGSEGSAGVRCVFRPMIVLG